MSCFPLILQMYLLFAVWVIYNYQMVSARSQLFTDLDPIAPPRNTPPTLIDLHEPSSNHYKNNYNLFGPPGLFHNNLFDTYMKDFNHKLMNSPNFGSIDLFNPKELVKQLNDQKESSEQKQDFKERQIDNTHKDKDDGVVIKFEDQAQPGLRSDPLKINLLPKSTTTTELSVLKTNKINEFPISEKPEISNTLDVSNSLQNKNANDNVVTDSIIFPDEIDEIRSGINKISKNDTSMNQTLPINETISHNANYTKNRESVILPVQVMTSTSPLNGIFQNSNGNVLLVPTGKINSNQILSNVNANNQNGLQILTPVNSQQGALYTNALVNLPPNTQQATIIPLNNNVNVGNQGYMMLTNIPSNQNIPSYLLQQQGGQPNIIDGSGHSINGQVGTNQYSTQRPIGQLTNMLVIPNNELNKNIQAPVPNVQQKPYYTPNNAVPENNNLHQNTSTARNQQIIPNNENVPHNAPQDKLLTSVNEHGQNNGIAKSSNPQNIEVQQRDQISTLPPKPIDNNTFNSKPPVFQNLGQSVTPHSLPNNNPLIANFIDNNTPKTYASPQTAGQVNSGSNVPNNLGIVNQGNTQPLLVYLQPGNQYNVGNDPNAQQYLLINMANSNINSQNLPQGSVILTSPNGNTVNAQGNIIPVSPVLLNNNVADGQNNLYTRVYIPNTLTNTPNFYLNNMPTLNSGYQQPYNVLNLNGGSDLGVSLNKRRK
ncbi:putative uncharacterized protein DDB_G0286901 [Achroia grisella]|uniref:putative uncharacterized protein DDB_G0286901 n=1 Tax=Achroia grisella TaxID=688607 RepID=UPI0027D3158E|nr:putative uncharacterized protein DDB_G0286901 [Achroia grisella]